MQMMIHEPDVEFFFENTLTLSDSYMRGYTL